MAEEDRFLETRTSKNPVIRAVGPGMTKASQTLYNRIGGENILDQIITDVYGWMAADKDMGKQFARFRLDRLKERTVDYLRGEWGGPEPYKGSDLWIAHSHIGIRQQWYDIMMKMFVKACKKARLAKHETQEVLDSIEKMRGPIVDSNLKLKNVYLKYSEKLAEEAGGDGWGTVAVTQEERAEKEKQTRIMIAKMKEEEMRLEEFRRATAMAKEMDNLPKSKSMTTPPKAAKADAKDGASDTTQEPGSGELPLPSSKPKAKAKPKELAKPKTDPAFIFAPSEDTAPLMLHSSAPSGAELLYRLSAPCR